MKITFMETDSEGSSHAAQLDGAVISTVTLNGGEATLVDGYSGGSNTADIVWQAGEKTLRVRTIGYSSAGTLRVAESVRRLTEDEKRDRYFWISDDQEGMLFSRPKSGRARIFPPFFPMVSS
jgi:hypothetical protein